MGKYFFFCSLVSFSQCRGSFLFMYILAVAFFLCSRIIIFFYSSLDAIYRSAVGRQLIFDPISAQQVEQSRFALFHVRHTAIHTSQPDCLSAPLARCTLSERSYLELSVCGFHCQSLFFHIFGRPFFFGLLCVAFGFLV